MTAQTTAANITRALRPIWAAPARLETTVAADGTVTIVAPGAYDPHGRADYVTRTVSRITGRTYARTEVDTYRRGGTWARYRLTPTPGAEQVRARALARVAEPARNDRVVHTGYPQPQEVWIVDRVVTDRSAPGGKVAECHSERDPRSKARYWVSLLESAGSQPDTA